LQIWQWTAIFPSFYLDVSILNQTGNSAVNKMTLLRREPQSPWRILRSGIALLVLYQASPVWAQAISTLPIANSAGVLPAFASQFSVTDPCAGGQQGPFTCVWTLKQTTTNTTVAVITYIESAGNTCANGTTQFLAPGYSNSGCVISGGVSGYIRPKYQVVGVYYAPPGAKSTATYSNGFLSGTSQSISNSFGTNVTVSSSGAFGLDLFGIFQANSTQTFSYGWEQQQNSSSSISIVQQQSTGSQWPGPALSSEGVDHDYDTIAVWLNPEVAVSVISPASVAYIDGYAFDPRDPAGSVDIVYLTVGQLNGTQSILGGTQTALDRTWDGSLGALNATDFAAIIQADPFSTNPAFNPSSDTSGRYVFPGGVDQTFSYEPEPQGAQASATLYTSSYNTTNTTTTGGSDKYTVGFSIDGTLSGAFFASAFAKVTASTTFTYTNTWSSTVTTGTTQSANFTIYRPLYTDGYTGDINMQIWKDNVYGTFMFYPVP
jgi:hypothetical protein